MIWFTKKKKAVQDSIERPENTTHYPQDVMFRRQLLSHARSVVSVDDYHLLRDDELGKLIIFNGVGVLIRGESANIPDLAYVSYLENIWNSMLDCRGVRRDYRGVIPRIEVIHRYDLGGVAEGQGYSIGSLEPVVPAVGGSNLLHRSAGDGLRLLIALQDVIPMGDMVLFSEHEKELIRNMENLNWETAPGLVSNRGQVFSRVRFKG